MNVEKTGENQTATLGGGCFWCIEAVFKTQPGVIKIENGYAGGHTANPTYEEVCSKKTGHAEVVNITYNPGIMSFEEILLLFFKAHDPTTPNQQGADIGPQYRSIILYHDNQQRITAEKTIEALSKNIGKKIVTEIKAFDHFYKAEDYHQDFYTNNKNYGYCQFVISPKLRKLGLE